MTTLKVGPGQTYKTIAAAVAAAPAGATIQVQAGTYTNDFAVISKDLTLQAVGGQVNVVATRPPINKKGILTVGTNKSSPNVSITGFSFSGAEISAYDGGNGAGVRYQSGNLTLSHDIFRGNQDGLLATPFVRGTGTISIDHSEFNHNGSGTGQTHNIYVGPIASFSLTSSYVHDAVVGHEVKTRAKVNLIQGNTIADNASTASYAIDLPNGGSDIVSGNMIEKGIHSSADVFIHFEGGQRAGQPIWAQSSLNVTDNVFVDDLAKGTGLAVWNDGTGVVQGSGNDFYRLLSNRLIKGTGELTGDTYLKFRPAIYLPNSNTSVTLIGHG